MADDQFPCPPPPRPPKASKHCRHYSYSLRDIGTGRGPRCAAGIDVSAPGATCACMPDPTAKCPSRAEHTDEVRAAWKARTDHSLERMRVVMPAIPKTGGVGSFPCPACGTGNVHWSRAARNGHVHAACSTPDCFAVMQ